MMLQKSNKLGKIFHVYSFVFLLLLQMPLHVYAGVVINGTRLVYRAGDKEITMRMNNSGDQPSLVQVWLDSGDPRSTPDTASAPFIATPPIFRIDPNKAQTVRIVYTQEALPEDKESVFWLNVLDIPPVPANLPADSNIMQMAIKSRIKTFFRPRNLRGSPVEAAAQVRWALIQENDRFVLRASNESVFHVSLNSASIKLAQKNYEVETDMLLPGASLDFPIKASKSEVASELTRTPSGAARVEYGTINDYGSVVSHTVDAKFAR